MVGVEFIRACGNNSEDFNDLVDYLLEEEIEQLEEARREAIKRILWIKENKILNQAEDYESFIASKEDLSDREFPEGWESPLPKWIKKQIAYEFYQWL